MRESTSYMQKEWAAELESRQRNVANRKAQKSSVYERRRQRQGEEDDPEFILSPGRIRGYDVVTGKVVKNTLAVDRTMKIVIEHSPEGLEFTPGNAASMLLKLSGSHLLAKAIVD